MSICLLNGKLIKSLMTALTIYNFIQIDEHNYIVSQIVSIFLEQFDSYESFC